MSLYKNKYRIESARLKGYDYARNGFYFVTICTIDKELYFGDVVKTQNFASVQLSKIGKIANKYWAEIPNHFPHVKLDYYVVMPNHVHGILQIVKNVNGATRGVTKYQNKFGPQSKNLSSIIRGYKIGVKKYSTMNNIVFTWQPRFHDRIIRNNDELNRIRQYIIDNPERWELDRNNTMNLRLQ